MDKRELAGKMAKLDAIELTKLSRRVSGEYAKVSLVFVIDKIMLALVIQHLL